MAKTLDEFIAGLPKKRQQRIAKRTQELVAEELALRELRQALKLTQRAVAKKLDIGQEGVSRLEQRTDLMLSTLRKYIEAVGGRLRIVAEFPDRPPVTLTGLAEVNGGKSK